MVKFFALPIFAFLIMVSLSGCSTYPSSSGKLGSSTSEGLTQAPTFNPQAYDTSQAATYVSVIPEERFRIGDITTITVNGFDEFSGIYTVGRDGTIFLGHVGNVHVVGKTIPELQSTLHKKYSECCLVRPNISIEKQDQLFGKIVVDGAVNDAGVFEIDGIIKLSEAIALAGGISEIANPEMTVLSREINGERRISKVNLVEIRQFGANDPSIYPNDAIFIEDSRGRLLYKDFVKTLPLISAVLLATTR